jgi:hypothetical protein
VNRRNDKVGVASIAFTVDGTVLLNVAASYGPASVSKLLERAVNEGRPIFVGIALTREEVAFTTGWLDGATAEMAGVIWGQRQRRRRAVARKIRKTPSPTSAGTESKR